jgi:hypothetical protein
MGHAHQEYIWFRFIILTKNRPFGGLDKILPHWQFCTFFGAVAADLRERRTGSVFWSAAWATRDGSDFLDVFAKAKVRFLTGAPGARWSQPVRARRFRRDGGTSLRKAPRMIVETDR